MKLDVRSSSVLLSDALRAHVDRRLGFTLRRFARRVASVAVRLVDVNGPKGGPDKRCRIVVRLEPAGSVIVEATEADAYVAVSEAALRLDERMARVLTRRRPRPPAARHGGARHRRAVAAVLLAGSS